MLTAIFVEWPIGSDTKQCLFLRNKKWCRFESHPLRSQVYWAGFMYEQLYLDDNLSFSLSPYQAVPVEIVRGGEIAFPPRLSTRYAYTTFSFVLPSLSAVP